MTATSNDELIQAAQPVLNPRVVNDRLFGNAVDATSGEVRQGSGTVVGVNGLGAVVVLGLPLLATVLVGCALWLRSRRGAVPSAWTLTGLLAGFNLLAMASIGLFVLPVTAAVMVACATCRREPKQQNPAAAAAA